MLLEDIEFLKGLSKVEQARLLGSMEEEEFPAGSIIFKQGDKGDCMYILTGGTIELSAFAEDGSERTLSFMGEGEVLGEMAMLTDSPRTATATVVNKVTLYKMSAQTFNKLLDENVSLSLYLSRLLSRRLARSDATGNLKILLLMDDMQKLSIDLQKVILFATAIPSCSIKFLAEYFKISELYEHITKDKDICAKVMDWREEDDLLTINSDLKDILKEFYNQKYSTEEKEKFILAATQDYVNHGNFVLALQAYSENAQWDEACKLVQGLNLIIPEQDLVWAEHMNFFQGCPDDIFFKYLDIFVLFLKVFLVYNQEVGYKKLEGILFNAQYSFKQEQKAVLYELAAEFCKKLGYQQKALEYLDTAKSIAATFGTQRSQESTDGQGSTYELEKRNVLGALGNAKAEKARKFIFENNKLTAVSLVAFSVIILGYFSHTTPVQGLSREAMTFLGISIAAVAFG